MDEIIRDKLQSEDGYDLWLRYRLVDDAERLAEYRAAITQIVFDATSPTLIAARDELVRGLSGLLGAAIPVVESATPSSTLGVRRMRSAPTGTEPESPLFQEGRFTIFDYPDGIGIAANSDVGVLYGVFHLLRHLQTHQPLDDLPIISAPKLKYRAAQPLGQSGSDD